MQEPSIIDLVKANMRVADEAIEVWGKKSSEKNPNFVKLQKGIHTTLEEFSKEDGRYGVEEKDMFPLYLLALSRDLVDSVMASLFRENITESEKDLVISYYALKSKTEVEEKVEHLTTSLKSLQTNYEEFGQKARARAAEVLQADEEYKSLAEKQQKLANTRKEFDLFSAVARGIVGSYEEAEQKQADYEAKMKEAQGEKAPKE